MMQDEVVAAQCGGAILEGPFSVSRAGWTADGGYISKVQKALTAQREDSLS